MKDCDGSIRDPSTNPLGKSLGYQFALSTTNPSEEKYRYMQIKLTIYSRNFLARIESRREDKPEITGDIVIDKASSSLLDEVETDQARQEPDEIIDIIHDKENKCEKSDEHETFQLKEKFSNAT
ncbi:hypothetical protein TNCV_4858971 [Trichonephila clavipes]|nr:hypothetical protein TNCV_4858971 [Trichonephila clavipes]